MQQFDPLAIYDRGLDDLDSLVGVERMIFMFQDFDNLMDMQGWNHFFLYDHHFEWYGEMKDWLRVVGETQSLAVLVDYESRVRAAGFDLSPAGVEGWLNAMKDTDVIPDWWRQYEELRDARWAKAQAHVQEMGCSITPAP